MTFGDSGGPVLYPYGTVLAAGLVTGVSGVSSNFGRDIYNTIYPVEKAGAASPQYTVVVG